MIRYIDDGIWGLKGPTGSWLFLSEDIAKRCLLPVFTARRQPATKRLGKLRRGPAESFGWEICCYHCFFLSYSRCSQNWKFNLRQCFFHTFFTFQWKTTLPIGLQCWQELWTFQIGQEELKKLLAESWLKSCWLTKLVARKMAQS